MNPISAVFVLAGGGVALLAGAGLLKFKSSYARFHAAGKASPVSFLLIAIGAAIELGPGPGALLLVTAVAMVITMPVGTHLLFRAVHRTSTSDHMAYDELADNGK